MRTLSTALCLVLVLWLHAPLHAQQASPPQANETLSGALYGPQLTPRQRSAQEDHDETNWSLTGPGIAALGAGWLLGWITSAVWIGVAGMCSEHPATLAMPVGTACPAGPASRGLWQMGVPLVGPWLSVAETIPPIPPHPTTSTLGLRARPMRGHDYHGRGVGFDRTTTRAATSRGTPG